MPTWTRYLPWFLTLVPCLWLVAMGSWWAVLPAAFFGLGILDLLQTQHAVRRNYPLTGRLRYMLEFIRPELRQYFLESDDESMPFSRDQRAMVYARAKRENDKRGFGSLKDPYAGKAEWLLHSLRPVHADPATFRVMVGAGRCTQPYAISVFNISALSFGALSGQAIRALNLGAARGGFAHDTGEGSISAYHRSGGGDLIWQIASGYFGCRTPEGHFDPELFARQAQDPQVKMIELKLSQGAKPGHGGVLPAAKISVEISQTRGVPLGQDCVSPAQHSAFSGSAGMLDFIAQLRTLSGGKPVGIKLCIGRVEEWFELVKTMLEKNATPDFIVLDGSEGGTGAAPVEFADHVGMPLRDALSLVHNTLLGAGLRDRVRIGVAGKVISAFDIVRCMALGADWCNSARGFMFAIGCIQSRSCHTDRCPTGVATQDPVRQRALVVPDKADRVFHFHSNTMRALSELLGAAGLTHPDQVRAEHIMVRDTQGQAVSFARMNPVLEAGVLLQNDDVLAALPVPYGTLWRSTVAAA